MPDNQSPEKAALLRTLGAEVQVVKTVPYSDANHYQKIAPRVAAEIDGAVCGNQFDNTANRDAHYATTGPEIWHETGGRIDAFTCATGTGGTLGGVSRYLKEQKPGLRVVLADQWVARSTTGLKSGTLKSEGSSSVTEGSASAASPPTSMARRSTIAVRVEDPEIVRTTYRLLHREGLFLGSTSGANVAAAVQVARATRAGQHGRYHPLRRRSEILSRFYNREWLQQKGLAEHAEPAAARPARDPV